MGVSTYLASSCTANDRLASRLLCLHRDIKPKTYRAGNGTLMRRFSLHGETDAIGSNGLDFQACCNIGQPSFKMMRAEGRYTRSCMIEVLVQELLTRELATRKVFSAKS